MPNNPVKHHYVQKAYLKRFSYDGKHVFVLRKEDNTIYPSNIKDVCSENNFNTRYDNKRNCDINIEIGLSKIENSYPNQLFKAIPERLKYPYQNGGIILGKAQKNALIETILLQLVRSKSTREFGQSVIDSVYKEELEEARKKFSWTKSTKKQVNYLRRNEEIIKRNALVESPLLFYSKNHNNNLIRSNLRRRNCIIYINHSSEDFVTSDNPVLIGDAQGNIRRVYDYPLINPDSTVLCPLDSSHIAVLLTPEYCEGYECEVGITAIYTDEDIDIIQRINKGQYRCSSAFVIANTRKSLNNLKHQ